MPHDGEPAVRVHQGKIAYIDHVNEVAGVLFVRFQEMDVHPDPDEWALPSD